MLLAFAAAGCAVGNWEPVTPHYTQDTAPHETFWWRADPPLFSIGFFGNNFYAVGESGMIRRSADGKNWATLFTGRQVSLHAIFGTPDGKHMWVVGDGGTILHSGDGEHWVSQGVRNVLERLRSVFGTSDGKQLWAVGDRGRIVHTTDGEHWVPQIVDEESTLYSIFGTPDGKHVWVVGDTPEYRTGQSPGSRILFGHRGTILYSADGDHWITQPSDTQAILFSVFGTPDGKHLWAVGDAPENRGGNPTRHHGTVLSSADGKHWATLSNDTNVAFYSVFGSKDGKDLWAAGGISPNDNTTGAIHGNNRRGLILHSTDGKHWALQSGSSELVLSSISGTPDGKLLCVVGGYQDFPYIPSSRGGAIFYSADGEHWSSPPPLAQGPHPLFATPDGQHIWGAKWGAAMAPEGMNIFYSNDGEKWTTQYSGPQGQISAIFGTSDGKRLWAVGGDWPGTSIYSRGVTLHTSDGQHWEPQHIDIPAGLSSVFGTADGKQLWAVGQNGSIFHSEDGEHWAAQASWIGLPFSTIFGTASGKDLWVVGPHGEFVKSGNDLVPFFAMPRSKIGYRMVWRGTLLHSDDGGKHWAFQDSGTPCDLNDIQGTPDGKRLWIATGNFEPPNSPNSSVDWVPAFQPDQCGPGIISSTDGEHWVPQESPARAFFSIFATPDRKQLWAVGSAGRIIHSTDGEHWADQKSTSDLNLDYVFGTSNANRLWVHGYQEGRVEAEIALNGYNLGRTQYVESARLETTLTGAVLEIRVSGPTNLPVVVVRNDFDFGHKRPPADFAALPLPSHRKADVWAFEIDPSKADIARGQIAHFEISLNDGLVKQKFDYAAVYDPLAPLRDNARWLIPISAPFLILFCFTTFLFTRPLWNLYLYRRLHLHKISNISIPSTGDLLKPALRFVTVLPWYARHPRTLDAWIEHNRRRLETYWNNTAPQAASRDGTNSALSESYVQLPIRVGNEISGVLIQHPTWEHFNPLSNQSRWNLQIVGPGGAGKTTLARQIGRWTLDGSVRAGTDRHKMFPIWIDEDLGDTNRLFKVIREKLFAALPDEDVESDFCEALLRKQRLLVIIDRLSERSTETQEYIRNMYRSTRLGALVLTSRISLPVDGLKPAFVFPQPLNSASLLFFMTSLLAIFSPKRSEPGSEETRPLATMNEQLMLGKRLASLIQVRTPDGRQEIPMLPLPVRLFVEQAVELLLTGRSLDDLPKSLPEVYVQYLRQINPKTGPAANHFEDEDMLKAAKILAKLALQPNFIPKEFSIESTREALRSSGQVDFERADPIERLKHNGVILQKQVGAYSRLRFVLDPIAEAMGAFAYAEECGANKESWKRVLEASVAAPGFHVALKLIRQAYGEQLGWALDKNM